MMKWVFGLIIIFSVFCSIFTGNTQNVTNALLEEGVNAIELCIYLTGGMCVWGGLMKVAEKSGITSSFSKLFTPIGKRLFHNIDTDSKAFSAITMNIAANLFGLGNAATPLGLEAMRELEKNDGESEYASDNMIIFTVLNTASITLIPTTVASLRLKYGAQNAMDILPAVLISSAIALIFSLSLAKLLCRQKGE